MIGVIPKPHQVRVVEEFFELFKTPWEFYSPGQVYDVIVATTDEIPEVTPKLLLVYGPATKSIDPRFGIAVRGRHQNATLSNGDISLPIYNGLVTFTNGSKAISCITAASETAGLRVESPDSLVLRLGYDLFDEVEFLLSTGQPPEHAPIPTLDIHIRMMREWILQAGIPLLEIPPTPADRSLIVCLTHDIDFAGIRYHRFDHSMWGFLCRATLGALRNFVRGRLSLTCLLRSWLSVASLPFVYAGWARDFWEPFEWYLRVERGLPATYFLIPFKRCPGENVPGPHASRRATAYEVSDISHSARVLVQQGCEIGVHGIDAWHSDAKGRDELTTLATVTRQSSNGIRVHWLLRDANTPTVLERAGYAYDSSFGYNETIGYRAGTNQVFRPLGAETLLELPLHIQDGALFYRQRLDLSEQEAEKRCRALIDNASTFGGVLTLLWHDRSHAPERFWGDFYVKLLHRLTSLDCWFGTAAQIVSWFRKRRHVRFEQVEASLGTRTCLRYEGEEFQPPLKLRVYTPKRRRGDRESVGEMEFSDIPWDGKSVHALEFQVAPGVYVALPGAARTSLS